MLAQAADENDTMKQYLPWLLWLWISAVIVAAFLYAPQMAGFEGLYGKSPESGRILFFHVPTSIASFIAFLVAAYWSCIYLWKWRSEADHAALAAVELGALFCALAIVTGAVWAKVQWGEPWTWDPRQTTVLLALVYYAAYLSLRGAIEDPETRARIAGAYGALGGIVAPFLFFILPRMVKSGLHNTPGETRMGPQVLVVFLASLVGFTALFFWMHHLRRRILAIEESAGLPDLGNYP